MQEQNKKCAGLPAQRVHFKVHIVPFILIFSFVFLILVLVVLDAFMSRHIIRERSDFLEADVETRTIDGANLSFRRYGETGEVLLLIHGFMGSSWDFHEIMPQLSQHFQIVAVDQIGFGLSDKSEELDFSKAGSARFIELLMQDLGYQRYHIAGHSMGGEVAMHITLNAPEKVSSLILISSAGMSDLQQGHAPQLPVWLIDSVFKNYALQRIVFWQTVAESQSASLDAFNDFYFFNSQIPAASLARMTAVNDSGSIASRIAQIEHETLIVWGRQDKIIPLEQGMELNKRLTGSRLLIFEHCGHLPYLEQPDQLGQAIINFLTG